MWLGYNQSLRPAEVGITLNIDMAATAFLEVQKLMDYISRVLGIRPNQLASADPRLIKKASKAITGIKVAALHGGGQAHLLQALCPALQRIGLHAQT